MSILQTSLRNRNLNSLQLNPSRNYAGGIFDFFKKGEKEVNEKEVPKDVEVKKNQTSEMWFHLSDQEIAKIQDKSGLPDRYKNELRGIPHHGQRLPFLRHYTKTYIRSYYGKYGSASGLKPGVCWPSKSEMEFKLKFEETFYPSLNEMRERKKKEREESQAALNKYRGDMLKKLEQLPKMKEEFMRKYNNKLEEAELEKIKREKLIQQVREYLGFDVAPSDARFQEALLKMEEETKSASKANKKQEKQARILAKLAEMAGDVQPGVEKDGEKKDGEKKDGEKKDEGTKKDPGVKKSKDGDKSRDE